MIEICPLEPADLPAVLKLWRETEGLTLGAADSPEELLRYLDRNPGLSVVAKVEGRIVGAVLSGHDGRRGYLHHLAVEPAHRNHGIGEAMVRRCLLSLRAAGIMKSHVFVREDNNLGQRFWSHHGWFAREDLVMFSHL